MATNPSSPYPFRRGPLARAALCLALAAAGACGSGDGDGGSAVTTPHPVEPLPALPTDLGEALERAMEGIDGEMVLADAATGEVLAATDPAGWGRAAPPGSLLQPFLAAVLLDRFLLRPGDVVVCSGRVGPGDALEPCGPPGGHGGVAVWGALAAGCDHFFGRISARFGTGGWRATGSDLGLVPPGGGPDAPRPLPLSPGPGELERMGAGGHPGVLSTPGALLAAWGALVGDGQVLPIGTGSPPEPRPRGLPSWDTGRALLHEALRQRAASTPWSPAPPPGATVLSSVVLDPGSPPRVHTWALASVPSRGLIAVAHNARTLPGADARDLLGRVLAAPVGEGRAAAPGVGGERDPVAPPP